MPNTAMTNSERAASDASSLDRKGEKLDGFETSGRSSQGGSISRTLRQPPEEEEDEEEAEESGEEREASVGKKMAGPAHALGDGVRSSHRDSEDAPISGNHGSSKGMSSQSQMKGLAARRRPRKAEEWCTNSIGGVLASNVGS